jgi:hypothetical protein
VLWPISLPFSSCLPNALIMLTNCPTHNSINRKFSKSSHDRNLFQIVIHLPRQFLHLKIVSRFQFNSRFEIPSDLQALEAV